MWSRIIIIAILPVFLQAQDATFKEVSDEKGMNYHYPGNDFQMAGGGVLIIDVNNDGWDDVFQSGGIFDSKLWINDKGQFRDATAEYGLNFLKGYHIQGAVRADIDNDGYADFIVLNYGIGMGRGDKKHPIIMRNIDGKYFEPMILDSVLEKGNYTGATWGDINHDGYVDVYLTNYVQSMGEEFDESGEEIGYDPTCYRNKLLINHGGKYFTEESEKYGVDDIGCGFAATFSDVDHDGHVDLLLLNDFGEWTDLGNRLFKNRYPEEKFDDVSEQFGFNQKMYGMGIGVGDVDEDGDLDYYITNIGRNYLFKNQNGSFQEVGLDYGVDLTYSRDSILGTSWSGIFFDLDFNGDLDLYVSKGNILTFVPKTVIADPNQLFVQKNGQFINVSSVSGIDDPLSHRGAAYLDFDRDGDLDLVSSCLKLPLVAFKNKDQKIKLYENQTPNGNYIGIRLIGGEGVNRDCYGCRVLFETDERQLLHEVDNGRGHASQSTATIYYGLGKRKKLPKLTIFWENGATTEIHNLRANRVYEIAIDGKVRRR